MTQYYIGTKIIQAWPEVKDGKEGYAVQYEDSYTSWSPKETFEKAYLPMGELNNGCKNSNTITQEMVADFIENVEITQLDEKTTVVKATCVNGFVLVESSSCVDPANYDTAIGRDICLNKIKDKLWFCLGFLLQTARNGVKSD